MHAATTRSVRVLEEKSRLIQAATDRVELQTADARPTRFRHTS